MELSILDLNSLEEAKWKKEEIRGIRLFLRNEKTLLINTDDLNSYISKI